MESVSTLNEKINVRKKKPHAKLGYTELDTAELVTSMNILMSNLAVHYQKLRNYHWNVKGEGFFELHTQFENQYKEVQLFIDSLAERIRVFGKTPMSTLKEYLENSEIKENATLTPANDMVQDILVDYRILLKYMTRVVDISMDNNDMATEDLVRGFIKSTEKHHWMFTAYLHAS